MAKSMRRDKKSDASGRFIRLVAIHHQIIAALQMGRPRQFLKMISINYFVTQLKMKAYIGTGIIV